MWYKRKCAAYRGRPGSAVELFVRWVDHFMSFTKPDLEKGILLLLHDHSTPHKDIDALKGTRCCLVSRVLMAGNKCSTTTSLHVAKVSSCLEGL